MKIKYPHPLYKKLYSLWAGSSFTPGVDGPWSFCKWLNKNGINSRYEYKDYINFVWNYWFRNKAQIQLTDGWYGVSLLFDMGEYYKPIIIASDEKALSDLIQRL